MINNVMLKTYNFLHHVHNLLFDKIKVLSIASRSTADNIVNLDIVVILSDTTAIHSVGELDKHGVLFHDPLNVLPSNTNDTLVVLVRDVERNRRRHLLFDKVQTVFRCLVLRSTNIDVEIVLVEAVKQDLYVA